MTMKSLEIFIILTLSVILGPVLNGYTLSTLWGWFVVPTFGAPGLSVGVASGLVLLVAFLTYQRLAQVVEEKQQKSHWEKTFENLAWLVLRPLVTLAMGAVIKHWA